MIPSLYSWGAAAPYFPFPQREASSSEAWRSISDLADWLTASDRSFDEWRGRTAEIKAFIELHRDQLADIHQLVTKCTVWGLPQNSDQTLECLIQWIDLPIFRKIIRQEVAINREPADVASLVAERVWIDLPPHEERRFAAEWQEYRSGLLSLPIHFLNIVFDAVASLDMRRKLTTDFSRSVLLQIICQFFLIPYALVVYLRPFFATALKTHLAVAGLLVSIGALISAYQRWWRPKSDVVVCCTNLDQEMVKGRISPKIGQTKELQLLAGHLEVGNNVIIVADSGEGKTTLVHHFIQKKQAGEFSEHLRKLTVFKVDCGLVTSTYGFGHSEILNQIKAQAGEGDEILFFFEEFYLIASDAKAFKDFRDRILKEKPGAQFIAAMTTREYVEVMGKFDDGSFRRRISPLAIEKASDSQIELIVRQHLRREAADLVEPSEGVIRKLVELSKSSDYLPGVGRPAKALKLLNDAMGVCRTNYSPHQESSALLEARESFANFQVGLGDKLNRDQRKRLVELRRTLSRLESQEELHKQNVVKLKQSLAARQKMRTHRAALTHAYHTHKFLDSKDEIRYLWTHFYAIEALTQLIGEQVQKIDSSRCVQIHETLIQRIYDESITLDRQLQSAQNVIQSTSST